MKILAWNCRGLARGPTIRALRALIRAHRPDLLFLSETKVSCSRFQPSLFGLGFSAWFEAPPSGLQGGLYMTWKTGVVVDPICINKNCISCLVSSDPSHSP
jgi:exonuclease III